MPISNRIVGLCMMLLIVSNPNCKNADAEDAFSAKETGAKITQFLNYAHHVHGFSGVVFAARDGEVVCYEAVGLLNNNPQVPIRKDTLFEIASATKPFTAMAVLLLEEQGKLKLDDPMSKWLPGVPESCSEITVEHLIRHTSGIPGTNTGRYGTKLEEVLPGYLLDGPKNPPGTKSEYWNQGYSLLTEIIARASGQPYVDFVRKEIFAKCGMKNSCFTGEENPSKNTVAVGQSVRGNRSALEPPYGDDYGFQYRGMGGMVTTASDLWKFDRAVRDRKLLSEESVKKLLKPGINAFGCGWYLGKDDAGNAYHHHSGAVRGFRANIFRFPKTDGCLFVLSNNEHTRGFQLTTEVCRQLILNGTVNGDLPEALAPEMLTGIAGDYQDARGRKLRIVKDGGVVTATIEWGGPLKTNAVIGNTKTGQVCFFAAKGKHPMKFSREQNAVKTCSLLTMTFKRQ